MSDPKAAVGQFVDLCSQVDWLARRLAEARILVEHERCSQCAKVGPDACTRCWREEAARVAREERHAKL